MCDYAHCSDYSHDKVTNDTSTTAQQYLQAIGSDNPDKRIRLFNNYYQELYEAGAINNIISLLETEVSLSKQEIEHDQFRLWKLHTKLGYWLNECGEINASIHHYKQAYPMGSDTSSTAQLYYNNYVLPGQAVNYAMLGDYKNAIELAEQTQGYLEKNKVHPSIVNGFNNLGEYYELLHDKQKAKHYFQKTIEYRPIYSEPFRLANAYLGLGRIKNQENQAHVAIQFLKLAIKTASDISEDRYKNTILSAANENLIESYYLQQDINLMRAAGEQSVRSALKIFPNGQHRTLARIYNTWASCLEKLGENDLSIKKYQGAINAITGNDTDVQKLVSLTGILKLEYESLKKDLNENEGNVILEKIERVIPIYHNIRNSYYHDDSKYSLASYMSSSLDLAIKLCTKLNHITKDEKYLAKALDYAEINRAIALNDALENNLIGQGENLQPYFKKKTELTGQLWQVKLEENQEKTDSINLLIRELDNKIKTSNELHSSSSERLNLVALQEKLASANSILIVFIQIEDQLQRFKINSNQIAHQEIQISEDFLDQVDCFNKGLTFKGRHQFDETCAKALFTDLWPTDIETNKTVFIITDGITHNLAFDALLNENSEYLVQLHPISYLQSIQSGLMQNIKESQYSPTPLLTFHPIFNENNELTLSESEVEIEQLKELLICKSYKGEKALKKEFLGNLNQYNAIHFSTHGDQIENIASARIKFYDEGLFVQELYNYRLPNQLVVMEACETSLGELETSEGIMSLSRGFTYAGVPSVVSSFWKINESASTSLIVNFYKNLSPHQSAIALQKSKLNYLENDEISIQNKTPYYWAGIVHWGKNAKIKLDFKPKSNYYFSSIILIVFSILILILLKRFLIK